MVNNIFDQFFQYGFHDTEITSIIHDGRNIKLNFNKGIYLLDENGKETILSKPMQVILKINSDFDSLDEVFEIKEFGKKFKYIDYILLEKYLQKDTFGILMTYYSKFNSSILFEGGINNKKIIFSIDEIAEITFCEL